MPTGRRSLMRSLPPLWLIGVCLFLPTVRACEKMESPASLLWGEKPFFLGLLAPYLVAQLLVVLGIVALARGRVSPLVTRATATLVVLAGASAALLAVIGLEKRTGAVDQAWSVFAGGCFAAAVAVLVRARSLEPWTRLAHFYAAYTIFTLPLASLLARIVVGDGWHKVGYGAPLFLAAVAALAVVHARTLARTRDPVSSSAA
jgi:hypothetical protein